MLVELVVAVDLQQEIMVAQHPANLLMQLLIQEVVVVEDLSKVVMAVQES